MKDLLSKQASLRQKLLLKLENFEASLTKPDFDVIVSHCEINDHHGVGILLKRIFANQKNILSIRSTNLYDGKQAFGDCNLHFSFEGLSQLEILTKVQLLLARKKPRRILSVPYYSDDVLISIILKDLFNLPLCTYLMDDQNIYANGISDDNMRELLQKSDLCLGISQELCQAYEKKFGCQFWFLPPVAPEKLIQKSVSLPINESVQNLEGVLVGNMLESGMA